MGTPPRIAVLPQDYPRFLSELKERIRTAQVKAALSVNRELIALYWDLGGKVLERVRQGKWGTAVIKKLSLDINSEFPGIKGFSPQNIRHMRAFYRAWTEDIPIRPQAVGELDSLSLPQAVSGLPWGHNIILVEKLHNPFERLWYARQALENGWSRNVLVHQIESGLHLRQGQALTNFKRTLPAPQSDLAQEVLKDEYAFDFLASAKDLGEREVESGLLDHVQRFLLELGTGFAFVGRQHHLEVGGEDFYLDMLFYHLRLRCFVVIELKAGAFRPEHAGKMSFYLSATDELLRHPEDRPSIGIILCKSKNRVVAEYALRDMSKPIGVASYRATRALPEGLKRDLPGVGELEGSLGGRQEEAKGKAPGP